LTSSSEKSGKKERQKLPAKRQILPLLSLTDTNAIRIVPISGQEIEQIRLTYPFFVYAEIPAGTYRNPEQIPTVAIQNLMVVRADMPEEVVYNLTKELFENLPTLKKAHSAAGMIDPDSSWRGLPLALHPGAERYYREKRKK
jgi:hypothetical protein